MKLREKIQKKRAEKKDIKWLNSLSEEERAYELERRRKQEIQRHIESIRLADEQIRQINEMMQTPEFKALKEKQRREEELRWQQRRNSYTFRSIQKENSTQDIEAKRKAEEERKKRRMEEEYYYRKQREEQQRQEEEDYYRRIREEERQRIDYYDNW
jgi:hypothetical protein